MPLFISFLLVLSFLCGGCSSIRSGSYIQLRGSDSLESVAKEFNVSKAAILSANRGKSWEEGEWFFIPLKRGILSELINQSDNDFGGEVAFEGGGIFLWPVPSSKSISSRYGEVRGGRVHQGIDIPATKGESFVAADDGEVIYSDFDRSGYGRMILLKHANGLQTLYAHASAQLVKVGQKITRGQIIGLIGATGRATGPHLHFEVRRDQFSMDPLRYVVE